MPRWNAPKLTQAAVIVILIAATGAALTWLAQTPAPDRPPPPPPIDTPGAPPGPRRAGGPGGAGGVRARGETAAAGRRCRPPYGVLFPSGRACCSSWTRPSLMALRRITPGLRFVLVATCRTRSYQ